MDLPGSQDPNNRLDMTDIKDPNNRLDMTVTQEPHDRLNVTDTKEPNDRLDVPDQQELNARTEEEIISEEANVCVWRPGKDLLSSPTNLTLQLQSWQFSVHKNVLAQASKYFAAMFNASMLESTKDVIELHLIEPEHFKILVEGIYAGQIEFNPDNIWQLVPVAEMLQLSFVFQLQYLTYMRTNLINLNHCLELMYFCAELNLTDVFSDARRFCLAHFSELRTSSPLQALSVSELSDYLSDPYLVVEEEVHVLEAIHSWLLANRVGDWEQDHQLKSQVDNIVSSCVHVSGGPEASKAVAQAVFNSGTLQLQEVQHLLTTRPRLEQVFMFWSRLTSTKEEGLVDVVQCELDTGQCLKFDSMTDVVADPGFDLGSAVCSSGPFVYLSGGGPSFGKSNWIRQIWRFDVSKPNSRWDVIGDLLEFRRCHAMLALDKKLYILGGFGKFRTKNSKMHSFDLQTGNWEELPPMPVHELKPAAAVSGDSLLYVSAEWTIFRYQTSSRCWSALTTHNLFPDSLPVTAVPVACHGFQSAGAEDCLAVVAVTDSEVIVPVVAIVGHTVQLCHGHTARAPNAAVLTGSLAVSGRVALFFSSDHPVADTLQDDQKDSHMHRCMTFNPRDNVLIDLPAIHNVRKAQSFVALPYFPSSFRIGGNSCLEVT